MAGTARSISISTRQRRILEKIERSPTESQQLTERCRIVLKSAGGESNLEQADALGIDRQRVGRWRARWYHRMILLSQAEENEATDEQLEMLIRSLLSDNGRSGRPQKFTPEAVTSIISVACEPPRESGVEASHWTGPDLAKEVVKRSIVDAISPRQIMRFFARRPSGRT